MTLVELRYLTALASERHFGRAAQACHISQPALSAGIKNLEDELGVKLVDRSAGVQLTSAGERVVAQARRVLDEAARVAIVARAHPEPLTGTLRVGAISTLAPFVLGPLVVPLLKKHPKLDLVLREGLTHELVSLIRLGELDAALVALPLDDGKLASMPLFEEPFLALLPATSALVKHKSVTAGDLVSERLILLTEGHCFRDQALEVCRGHLAFEEPGRDQLAATSLHTIVRMVEAGLGCTLLPQLAADDLLKGQRRIELRPLARPIPSRTIGLVWRAGAAAADDVRAFGDWVRGHLPTGVKPAA